MKTQISSYQKNTFMQSQIWCWLATQDFCVSLFLDNEEFPCELLKVVALYPAPFVIGELTLYIAWSKNPQVSLVKDSSPVCQSNVRLSHCDYGKL